MHRYFLFGLTVFALLASSVPSAYAHSHSEFRIGNKVYEFVVGSLNEPVAVDDKTGVDLRISEEMGEGMGAATPVIGLEKDLKVELQAGDKKKVLELSPVFNTPGAYKANFIPTVQTTYTYRVFGKINGVDVNLSFACNPAGHPQVEVDAKPVEISSGVTQLEKGGAFGCPAAKAGLGFPESVVSEIELATKDQLMETRGSASMAQLFGTLGIVLGLAACALALKKR